MDQENPGSQAGQDPSRLTETALIGREALIDQVVREIKKGKHVVLTGPVGIGKSAVLRAALKRIEPRRSQWRKCEPVAVDAGAPDAEPVEAPEEPAAVPGRRGPVLVYLSEHQAKGQFVQMARRLIGTGVLKPSALDLAKKYDAMAPRAIEWASICRHVKRLSIRDLTAAIIPAIYAYPGSVLIAVDDPARFYDPPGVWVEALRFVCDTVGADGLKTGAEVVAKVATYLHGSHGLRYDTRRGASAYGVSGSGGIFELKDYLAAADQVVNCYD